MSFIAKIISTDLPFYFLPNFVTKFILNKIPWISYQMFKIRYDCYFDKLAKESIFRNIKYSYLYAKNITGNRLPREVEERFEEKYKPHFFAYLNGYDVMDERYYRAYRNEFITAPLRYKLLKNILWI